MAYTRQFLFAAVIVALAFAGCSKKMTNLTVAAVPFTYSVTGLSDMTVRQYMDTFRYVRISIAATGGVSEDVTITIDSLPRGVTFSPMSNSGMPDFLRTFEMRAAIDNPGTFPISIRTSSATTVAEYHSFNIIVPSDSGCASAVAGYYTNYTNCPGLGPPTCTYNSFVTGRGSDQVSLPCAFPMSATFNCHAMTFTTFRSSDISGLGYIPPVSGTFTLDTIIINYQIFDNTSLFVSNCTTILSR